MSLRYALEVAVNGTTGPRATLFTDSIAPSGAGVSPGNDQRRGFSRRRGGLAEEREILKTETSRRSRLSSSRSSLVRPWRAPRSTSAWRTQLRNVWPEIPRSFAIVGTDRSELERTSATASRRNSLGYGGRDLAIETPSSGPDRAKRLGVHESGGTPLRRRTRFGPGRIVPAK